MGRRALPELLTTSTTKPVIQEPEEHEEGENTIWHNLRKLSQPHLKGDCMSHDAILWDVKELKRQQTVAAGLAMRCRTFSARRMTTQRNVDMAWAHRALHHAMDWGTALRFASCYAISPLTGEDYSSAWTAWRKPSTRTMGFATYRSGARLICPSSRGAAAARSKIGEAQAGLLMARTRGFCRLGGFAAFPKHIQLVIKFQMLRPLPRNGPDCLSHRNLAPYYASGAAASSTTSWL